jgi:solute carrier family 25 citrate transporter 1
MTIGLISGAMGPFTNAPVDTIKTRKVFLLTVTFSHCSPLDRLGLQKATFEPGQTALQRVMTIASDMWKNEGFTSFYKGITPRVLRVAPGQAIVFAVYERVSRILERINPTLWEDDGYSE